MHITTIMQLAAIGASAITIYTVETSDIRRGRRPSWISSWRDCINLIAGNTIAANCVILYQILCKKLINEPASP